MPSQFLSRRSWRTAAGRLRRRLRESRVRQSDDLPVADEAALRPSRFSAPSAPAGLLVPRPVFLFSSVRSGSTLLQMILDSHSMVHAPHEMHLAALQVQPARKNARRALRAMHLDEVTVSNLLWDRLLDVVLRESGKSIIVDKTPNTTLQWRRVVGFWPDARVLLLLRHPLHIAQSLVAALPKDNVENHYERVNVYAMALAEAQAAVPDALTVRYERLTAAPEDEARRICDWLGIPFEARMLDYGAQQHDGQFKRGLGDWSDTIRSGAIRPPAPEPAPDDVPEQLRDAVRLLGY